MRGVRSPTPVFVPVDARFRRRRAEVRRTEGRRRLRLLVTGVGALALTGGGWGALRSPVLDVDRVVVAGAQHTPHLAVVGAAAVEGKAMIDLDIPAIRARVERLPWVAQARVRADWPGTVRVSVVERTAVAAGHSDESGVWVVLDGYARALEILPERPPHLMAIEGIGPVSEPGVEVPEAGPALAVVASTTASLAPRIASVVLVEGGLELRLNPQGTVRIGTEADAAAKLQAVETVLTRVDTRNLSTLDVRLPESPVLTRG